jgi:hypothetical protein
MNHLSFCDFAAKVLLVELTPAQHALASVAFDGLEPEQLSDQNLARSLFGEAKQIPPEARGVLVAVCGARAGKSYVLGALYSLWRALVADTSGLAPGEQATALIVGPDMRLARQVLRYALGAAEGCRPIKMLIESQGADGFLLRRPDKSLVAVECLPATRGGSALRGRSLVSAVLDECAFFRSDDHVINDGDVFRAVAPRVMSGGMVVLASTPWVGAGLLFSEFDRNHGHAVSAIAAHAPTTLLRPDSKTKALVERERERDADNARREFDAEFLASGASSFFDGEVLEEAAALWVHEPPDPDLFAAGADFAFLADASALVVVSRSEEEYRVADVLERRPTKSVPLVPSAVVGEFAARAKKYGVQAIVADSHGKASVVEHLGARGLEFIDAPAGQRAIAQTYLAVRDLLVEGRLALPRHDRLLRQMVETVATPLLGGGLRISHPRVAGGHGDLVSALVLAVWRARHVDDRILVGGGFRFDSSDRHRSGDHDWDDYCAGRDAEDDLQRI